MNGQSPKKTGLLPFGNVRDSGEKLLRKSCFEKRDHKRLFTGRGLFPQTFQFLKLREFVWL